MGKLKEKYKRFKHWQEQPYEYKLKSDEVHHCKNCNQDFTGNFCPICSQKADTSRICWSSVRQGVMDIWGLGSRSLLYSIWQLLLRPGHIIADYIDGKRQVCFPPVKMLFIVTLIYSFVIYWFLPDVVHLPRKENLGAIDELFLWYKNHLSWAMLIIATFAILPTWVMFRYSPRHTRHTIPEGFFIQVFLQIIGIVLTFLFKPLDYTDLDFISVISDLAVLVYYVIVYKHLFGYSLWGTIWRQGFVLLFGLITMGIVVIISFPNIFQNSQPPDSSSQQIGYILGWVSSILLPLIVLGIGYVVNKMATRIRAKKSMNKQA